MVYRLARRVRHQTLIWSDFEKSHYHRQENLRKKCVERLTLETRSIKTRALW